MTLAVDQFRAAGAYGSPQGFAQTLKYLVSSQCCHCMNNDVAAMADSERVARQTSISMRINTVA